MDFSILNNHVQNYSKNFKSLDPMAIAAVILNIIDESCGDITIENLENNEDEILDKLKERTAEALIEIECAQDWVRDNFKSPYLESIDVQISNSDFFVFLSKLPLNFMATIVDDLRLNGVNIYYTNYRKFYARIMPKVHKLFKSIIKKEKKNFDS